LNYFSLNVGEVISSDHFRQTFVIKIVRRHRMAATPPPRPRSRSASARSASCASTSSDGLRSRQLIGRAAIEQGCRVVRREAHPLIEQIAEAALGAGVR
jgi:hypothetical protein